LVAKRKLIKIGDGVGIILPTKLLAHFNAAVGDTLDAKVTADGFDLTKADPSCDDQMTTARDVMGKRKQALSELKSLPSPRRNVFDRLRRADAVCLPDIDVRRHHHGHRRNACQ
jgi:bifunctional DNA-binding transcriptional regulator/antitoxin component of YhaV-PrlF toxin-antitoxin module